MNYSKTTYFIMPVLDLKGSFKELKKDGFIDSYLGWSKHLGDSYGQYLYVTFDKDLLPYSRLNELETHKDVVERVIVGDTIIFIFNLNEDFKTKVIKPFIEGKYSNIDRKFVEATHPVYISEDTLSYGKNKVRLVLDKSDELKQEWEELLDAKLPENAEVWSIPSKETEILDYFN